MQWISEVRAQEKDLQNKTKQLADSQDFLDFRLGLISQKDSWGCKLSYSKFTHFRVEEDPVHVVQSVPPRSQLNKSWLVVTASAAEAARSLAKYGPHESPSLYVHPSCISHSIDTTFLRFLLSMRGPSRQHLWRRGTQISTMRVRVKLRRELGKRHVLEGER